MKKHLKAKKFLAMLLCFCMIAAVIPAGMPTASATDPIVFDFQPETPVKIPTSFDGFKTFDGGNWKYYSDNVTGVNAYATAYANVQGLNSKDNYLALELKNVESGVYDVSVSIGKAASGGISEWYIIPYEENANLPGACTPNLSLGKIDSYNASTLFHGAAPDENLEAFTAYTTGSYILVVRGTGEYNDAAADWQSNLQAFLGTLSLTRTGDAPTVSEYLAYDFKTGVPYDDAAFKAHNGGNWKYHSGSGVTTAGFDTVYTNIAGLSTANNYIAFKLDGISAGEYSVKFDIAKHKSGAIIECYAVPYSESIDVLSKCNAKTSLGKVDFYNDGLLYPWDAPDAELKNFNAYTDGSYLFVIRATGDYNSGAAGYSDNLQGWLAGLSMTRLGDPKEPSADPISLGFGSSNGGVALADIYNATITANKWAINTEETEMIDALTNSGRHGMAADYTNFKVYEDEVIAFDFEAAVAGDYELVLCVGENSDYGVNAEIFVNDVSVGKMFNDDNAAASTIALKNKGFGKVALEEGVNTLKIKGLAPDVVDAVTKTGSDRAGGTQLYLSTATFTPKETADVVVDRVEISCPNNSISVGATTSVSAKAIMSDGSEVAVTPKTITTGIIDNASGTVKGIGAGLALIEAEYEKDGVLYEDQVVIAVTNDAVFGNVFAYIDNDTITFLGGLKTINGYKEVGFDVYYGSGSEINVGAGYANPVTTANVYEKVTVGGTEYTTEYFGAGADGYIFAINETVKTTAGTTILVRPFVIDMAGNKIPYGKQYTMVVK